MWSSMVDFMDTYPMAWVAFIAAIALLVMGLVVVVYGIFLYATDPKERQSMQEAWKEAQEEDK